MLCGEKCLRKGMKFYRKNQGSENPIYAHCTLDIIARKNLCRQEI